MSTTTADPAAIVTAAQRFAGENELPGGNGAPAPLLTTNDRPALQLPGEGRPLGEFAEEAGTLLAGQSIRMVTAETVEHASMNGPEPEIDRASILRQLSKVAFDADHPPPEEPVVLSIAGVEVCHPGNITVIEAHQKSGKSSFVSAGIASTFASTDFDSLGWQSDGNRKQSTVLHFDTEQSRGDHYRLVMRALARAGLSRPPTWFESYSLTGWSCSGMRMAIEAAVDRAAAKHGGVHSIWIDGVADVVRSPNDEAESFEFVRWLQDMAITRACPIVGVLHLNPGKDGKSRGHLGSELNRKAETVLRLKKVGDVTIVTTEASRRAPIPIAIAPRFAWSDEAGRHTSVSSNRTDDVEVAEARKLVAAIWRDAPETVLRHRKLVDEIMRCEGKSESSAKRQIKVIQELNLVEKAPTGGGYVLTAEGLKCCELCQVI